MSEAALIIKDTGVLVVEYVNLPIADLSARFLYRFLEPVPTCWQEGSVSLVPPNWRHPADLGLSPERLEGFAREAWRDVLTPEGVGLLKSIERVEIHECHIVRK